MLDRIREGAQGPWAMVIIALIILSFVFAGVGSYMTGSTDTSAATVNGEPVSMADFDRAYQNSRARMESQFGEGIATLFSDEAYLKQFKQGVLDSLIGEVLVEQKAREIGLRVSDAQIKQAIVQMPEFQRGGQFDNEVFQALLRQNGFTPADFSNYMRVQMTREQLTRAISGSDFALAAEVEQAYAIQAQTRDGQYLVVNTKPFVQAVEISDDEVQQYYSANVEQFDTEEKVDLAYVVLNLDSLKKDISVSEEQIETYYQQNINAFTTPERRRVSHILVETGDDEAAAEQKAADLLARVEAGEDFAALAEANSDDTFSAENGGDLDFIEPDTLDPAFEEAAFALQEVGAVSTVVKSAFGYHIIKLTELEPSAQASLDEVTDEIRDTLVSDQAMDKFYQLQTEMDRLAFEIPESLEDVALAVNAEIQTSGLVTRATFPELLNNVDVISAAFSAELLQDGMNSQVIELDANNVAVVRINEYEPQRTKTIEEMRPTILATLRTQKAQQEAFAWGQTLLTDIKEGKDVSAKLAELEVNWQAFEKVNRNGNGNFPSTSESASPVTMPNELVSKLFTLSTDSDSNAEVVNLANGQVGIVELSAVHTAEPMSEQISQSLSQQLTQLRSQQDYQSFVEALRATAEVEITGI